MKLLLVLFNAPTHKITWNTPTSFVCMYMYIVICCTFYVLLFFIIIEHEYWRYMLLKVGDKRFISYLKNQHLLNKMLQIIYLHLCFRIFTADTTTKTSC